MKNNCCDWYLQVVAERSEAKMDGRNVIQVKDIQSKCIKANPTNYSYTQQFNHTKSRSQSIMNFNQSIDKGARQP